MPIEITTQRAAQAARRAITHCYICSDPLPERGRTGWKELTSRDHVIPASILSLAGDVPGSEWPLILDIHRDCEAAHKRHRDQMAKILQVMGAAGPRAWKPEELGRFRKQCTIGWQSVNGRRAPVIGNMDDALLAAHIWVRGFHAALYGQVLPADVGHVTRCPAPCSQAEGSTEGLTLAEEFDVSRRICGTLGRAIRAQRTDLISLRGGRIEYRCTWIRELGDNPEPWWCFWALDLPGCPDWAMSVRGEDAPWHGGYSQAEKPPGASYLEMVPPALSTPAFAAWAPFPFRRRR